MVYHECICPQCSRINRVPEGNKARICEQCQTIFLIEDLCKKYDLVSVIPDGYIWTCPDCDRTNKERGVKRKVKCFHCSAEFLGGYKNVWEE